MSDTNNQTSLEIRSKITSGGSLELSLERVELPAPGPDEVLVRIEASPINPSDLGLFFGPADMTTAKASGTADFPIITADVPSGLLKMVAARLDESLAVGNEAGGVVVAAGESDAAQALLGKTFARGTFGACRVRSRRHWRCMRTARQRL